MSEADSPGTSDSELLARTASDPEAFGLFYDRFEREMLAFFYRATQRADIAADLTAEVFAAALESIASFNPQLGSGRGWLFGIARHELADVESSACGCGLEFDVPEPSLTLAGHPTMQVVAGSPNSPAQVQIGGLLAQVLLPRRVTSVHAGATTVNSQTCATPKKSVASPSAPGAAGGSCTSVRRSTTTASSR